MMVICFGILLRRQKGLQGVTMHACMTAGVKSSGLALTFMTCLSAHPPCFIARTECTYLATFGLFNSGMLTTPLYISVHVT